MDLTLPALSIRQPWAWLITDAGKDVENRMWRTAMRGPFLIHAGKTMTDFDYDQARLFVASNFPGIDLPPRNSFELGGIVGRAEIVGCVERSDSKWFQGPYGFLIRNAVRLPFHKCRGELKFFKVKS